VKPVSFDLFSENGYVGPLATIGRYGNMATVLTSGTYEMRAFFRDGYTAMPKELARDIGRVLRGRRKLSRSARAGLADLRRLLLNRKVREIAIVSDG
jgi:hypothetical protein